MNYLVFNNVLVQDGVTITHTPDSGSITDATSQNKLLTRQLTDKYLFDPSTSGSLITFENIPVPSNANYVGMVSILNLSWPYVSINTVTVYSGATSYSTTKVSQVEDITYPIDGRITQSQHYKVDSGNLQNIDKIVLDVTLSSLGGNEFIGHVYAGEYVELSISPNVKYSHVNNEKADGNKKGVFFYTSPSPLKTIKAHVTNKTQSETSTFYQHSLNHSTSIPVVFISDNISYQTMYCLFQSPLSINTIEAKDSNGGWVHSADISIVENK